MTATAFKSKMPAGKLVEPETGEPTTQCSAYLQKIESTADSAAASAGGAGSVYSKRLREINDQSDTSYTFVLTDDGKYCRFTNGSAVTVTVPPNSSVAFEVGTQIDVFQGGAGKVTFALGSGVTINSFLSNKSLAGQGAGGTLIQTNTIDTWDLVGSLTA